jgi:hypothetical protein
MREIEGEIERVRCRKSWAIEKKEAHRLTTSDNRNLSKRLPVSVIHN